MEAIILMGLQASGKSTFFKQRFQDTHIRLNLDMLRTRNRERKLFNACLEAKQSFVIDNTNPTVVDRQRYIGAAKTAGFSVIGFYFLVEMAECLARNNLRENKRHIPESAIKGTAGKLEHPSLSEGFDALFCVRADGAGGFVVEEYKVEI